MGYAKFRELMMGEANFDRSPFLAKHHDPVNIDTYRGSDGVLTASTEYKQPGNDLHQFLSTMAGSLNNMVAVIGKNPYNIAKMLRKEYDQANDFVTEISTMMRKNTSSHHLVQDAENEEGIKEMQDRAQEMADDVSYLIKKTETRMNRYREEAGLEPINLEAVVADDDYEKDIAKTMEMPEPRKTWPPKAYPRTSSRRHEPLGQLAGEKGFESLHGREWRIGLKQIGTMLENAMEGKEYEDKE